MPELGRVPLQRLTLAVVWGVFVACSALTLVALTAPALVLLPRSAVTRTLFVRIAACALGPRLVGWGLVALLHPEYAIGWRLPGRSGGGFDVEDEGDAHLAGWLLLGSGCFVVVATITVGILPLLREAVTSGAMIMADRAFWRAPLAWCS